MGTCNFNHVKQKANGRAILLKVYGDGDIGFVVGRRPHVRSKIQSPVDEPLAALATDFAFSKQTRPRTRNAPTSAQDRPLTLN